MELRRRREKRMRTTGIKQWFKTVEITEKSLEKVKAVIKKKPATSEDF